MKKLFRLASLLLYFFSMIVFFFLGMIFAGVSGAAEGQGLAGGAIVVGYGVIAAFLALLLAVYFAWQAPPSLVVKINKVMGIVSLCFGVWIAYRFITRDGATDKSGHSSIIKEVKPVSPAAPTAVAMELEGDPPMGLGFFTPNFYENPVLYFYGNPNLEKGITEHMPTDSIVFKRLEVGGFDITYAPPWLNPEHLKLDYDMLYFRVLSIGWDFAEVVVNTTTQRTTYVNKFDGKLKYWPDFLLDMNTVEFLPFEESIVRVKPMNHASLVETPFEFMRPMLVQEDWMWVMLLDQDFKELGKGWIQWKKDGRMRILWNLLS